MNIEQLSQLFPHHESWIYYLLLFIGGSLIPFTIRSITPFTRLLSFISEARNRQILMARISQGSYDKETILQSTQFYISPKCSNIDPAQEEEVRQALMATRESLFEKIDYFIDHGSSKRHLLILADSGTGKTSFVLNYYAYSLRRRKRKAANLFLVSWSQRCRRAAPPT
jgi:predicted NACHT family NTPase